MSHNPCWARPDAASTWEAGRPSPAPPWGQAPAIPAVMDVLLVEDDALARETLGEVLAQAGWRVSEAADAVEALDRTVFDGMPGVLVTDLALIAAVRLRWPHLPAVLISGTDMAEPALGPGDRFLRKPFDADALARAVADLVAGQRMAGLDHAAA